MERAVHAALLTSKVYFYIGYYDEAVTFALRAGLRFEEEPAGEYKETILGKSAYLGSFLSVHMEGAKDDELTIQLAALIGRLH